MLTLTKHETIHAHARWHEAGGLSTSALVHWNWQRERKEGAAHGPPILFPNTNVIAS